MRRYSFERMDNKDNACYRIKLVGSDYLQIIENGTGEMVTGVKRSSNKWPEVLRVYGFEPTLYPVVLTSDYRTLLHMRALFYKTLYASLPGYAGCIRVYIKDDYRGGGEAWHIKNALSSELVDYITERGKVLIQDLIDMYEEESNG